MIRIRQLKVDNNSIEHLKRKAAFRLRIWEDDIEGIKIIKKSIDARKKPNVIYVYEIDVKVKNEEIVLKKNSNDKDVLRTPDENYNFKITGTKKMSTNPIIVGAGPAGLFCAYILAENGYKPLVIERGDKVEDRVKAVEEFWRTGVLNTESNVQFGEGGAGTFSDGKLNTLNKDKHFRGKKAFEIFVECGAPKEILTDHKPHIGTDLLRTVVTNMRNKIIAMGGSFRYNACLTDIKLENNKIVGIMINGKESIPCESLVLAIGHSARDTFKMLLDKNMTMEPKPFAIGVRIQHPQDMINKAQYGPNYNKNLEAASYKLTHACKNGRGVYTFCMCPGGFVVNSSSEKNRLCINGMSNYKRESENANSAVIVTISPKDFGKNPMDGIEFQRKLEEKAFELGKGLIPVQLFKDFVDNKPSVSFGNVNPVFKGNYTLTNLNDLFPKYITESLIEGIKDFNGKIKGFSRDDALVAAIESRTSSPIRIVRDDNGVSSISGIYPAGEGAGYAGGITSAAMDGIKVAEELATIYRK